MMINVRSANRFLAPLLLFFSAGVLSNQASLYTKGSLKFYLPPGSRAVDLTKCNSALVGQLADAKIDDVRQWDCLGYLSRSGSTLLFIKNREKPSQTYGVPSWLFKMIELSGAQVRNAGDIDARTDILVTLTAGGKTEVLGITADNWDGQLNNPPYARYLVSGLAGNSKLARITAAQVADVSLDERTVSTQSTNQRDVPRNHSGIERNLSDEFYVNRMAAIAKYSNWKTAPFAFSKVSFNNGAFYVAHTEVPSSFQVEHKQRMAEMNRGKDYWNNWFDMTSGGKNPMSQSWTLTCKFPASEGERLSAIREGISKQVQLKIASADDRHLVFDCKL